MAKVKKEEIVVEYKGDIYRDIYHFSCQQVDGDIDIPKAETVAKKIKETQKMDEVARSLLIRTRDVIQDMINNGDESEEIGFYEESLSKSINHLIAKEWVSYMENLGYEALEYFECEKYWLEFSVSV